MPRLGAVKSRRQGAGAAAILALAACAEPAVREVDRVVLTAQGSPPSSSSLAATPVASVEPVATSQLSTSATALDPREAVELELDKQDLLRKLEAERKKRKPTAPSTRCQPSDPLCE